MVELREIIERVKAATGPDRKLDASIAKAFGWRFHNTLGFWMKPEGWESEPLEGLPFFTASIDAALALTERLLPGTGYELSFVRRRGRFNCELFPDGDTGFLAYAPTAPLAILTALLLALSKQGQEP